MDIKTENLVKARYTPVFDTWEMAFNTTYCVPYRTLDGLGKVSGEALLALGGNDSKADHGLVLENMLGTVRLGLDKAQEYASSENAYKVIVPINGMALTDKKVALALAEFCKGFPEHLFQNLIFEVTNVSDSAAMSFLDDVAVILYLYCQSYACRISPATKDYAFYATCNYSGVSFSLGNKVWPVDQLAPVLAKIFKRAEDSRLKVYLHGIANADIRAAAESAGIRYLDGKGIAAGA